MAAPPGPVAQTPEEMAEEARALTEAAQAHALAAHEQLMATKADPSVVTAWDQELRRQLEGMMRQTATQACNVRLAFMGSPRDMVPGTTIKANLAEALGQVGPLGLVALLPLRAVLDQAEEPLPERFAAARTWIDGVVGAAGRRAAVPWARRIYRELMEIHSEMTMELLIAKLHAAGLENAPSLEPSHPSKDDDLMGYPPDSMVVDAYNLVRKPLSPPLVRVEGVDDVLWMTKSVRAARPLLTRK